MVMVLGPLLCHASIAPHHALDQSPRPATFPQIPSFFGQLAALCGLGFLENPALVGFIACYPVKYILRLWATITIQYTQNWKTHKVFIILYHFGKTKTCKGY
jgi:hypothetical protein